MNTLPRLGRLRATAIVGAAAVILSAFPSFIEEAQGWVTHLGNVAAPLTGVVLADYLVVQRGRIDVPALFDPRGRYRYRGGVNLPALLAVAAGVAAYYAVPDGCREGLWGIGVAALGVPRRPRVELRVVGRAPAAAPVSETAKQR